jgi:hypothetical protein
VFAASSNSIIYLAGIFTFLGRASTAFFHLYNDSFYWSGTDVLLVIARNPRLTAGVPVKNFSVSADFPVVSLGSDWAGAREGFRPLRHSD